MANHTVSEFSYEFHGPRYVCAYCADPADTIDHTVPRWFVSKNHQVVWRYRLIKVSACGECNRLASSVMDFTFSARKRRILRKATNRGRKLLRTGEWATHELEELGPGIRRFIALASADTIALRRRLAHLADPTWPEGVPDDLWLEWIPEDEVARRQTPPASGGAS